MARIIRSRQAREDILQIWSYIAVENRSAADKMLRQIDAIVELLAEQPKLGSAPPEIQHKNLRCMPVGNYVIYYESVKDGNQGRENLTWCSALARHHVDRQALSWSPALGPRQQLSDLMVVLVWESLYNLSNDCPRRF